MAEEVINCACIIVLRIHVSAGTRPLCCVIWINYMKLRNVRSKKTACRQVKIVYLSETFTTYQCISSACCWRSVRSKIYVSNLILLYDRAGNLSFFSSQKESAHYCRQFSSFRLNHVDTFPCVSDAMSLSSKLSNFLWFPASRQFFPSAVRSNGCLSYSQVLLAKSDLPACLLPTFQLLTYVTEGWMTNSLKLKMFLYSFFHILDIFRCGGGGVQENYL
jgi:hypothetical protein